MTAQINLQGSFHQKGKTKMNHCKEGEISKERRAALRAFGEVLPKPAPPPETTKRPVRPNPLRLITAEEVESLGLQVACTGCVNDCLGGSVVEIHKKQAVACRPTDASGIIGLRVGFNQGFEPSHLFCFQPRDGEDAVQIDLGIRVKTVSRSREKTEV